MIKAKEKKLFENSQKKKPKKKKQFEMHIQIINYPF